MSCVGSLDTNVILRFLLGDIPAQRQAAAELMQSCKGQLAVADLAVSETLFVLTKHYGIRCGDAVDMIQVLMGMSVINCNRIMLDRALDDYKAHPALSFEDCYLAAYAELGNAAPLYTFDKKLAGQLTNTKLL